MAPIFTEVIWAEISQPTAMPSRPPRPDSTIDSIRNWSRMSRRRAPIALRIPISRVRSVTVTSMMFMIPIPPTTSEMPAIAPSTRVRMPVIWLAAESRSCWLVTWKSAWAGSEMWWESSRMSVTSLLAASTAPWLRAWTTICWIGLPEPAPPRVPVR